MEYAFVSSWCQRKKDFVADALSRTPVSAVPEDDELAEDRAAQSTTPSVDGYSRCGTTQPPPRSSSASNRCRSGDVGIAGYTIQRGLPWSALCKSNLLFLSWLLTDDGVEHRNVFKSSCYYLYHRIVLPSIKLCIISIFLCRLKKCCPSY